MRYLFLHWMNQSPGEPDRFCHEIDDRGYEVRRVEVFPGGGFRCVDATSHHKDTSLFTGPFPSLEELVSDPDLKVLEFDCEQFDAIWNRALELTRHAA